MENPLHMEVLMGKSSVNWQFSMAMLDNQRVAILGHRLVPFIDILPGWRVGEFRIQEHRCVAEHVFSN